MKALKITGTVLTAITLCILCTHTFLTRLPDWAVRIDGVVMLVSLFLVSYSFSKKPR